MAARIRYHAHIGISAYSGLGMFANRNIARNAVIGYFSGPALNAETWNRADPNYISYARWTHPVTRQVYSYYFEVTTPSKFVNGGVHPRFLSNGSQLPMLASVELHQTVLKINRRYRPVLQLRSLRSIRKNEELLLDYGVLIESIFFEFLRRECLEPNARSEKKFRKFIRLQYKNWLPYGDRRSSAEPEKNRSFLSSFASDYFNR